MVDTFAAEGVAFELPTQAPDGAEQIGRTWDVAMQCWVPLYVPKQLSLEL